MIDIQETVLTMLSLIVPLRIGNTFNGASRWYV